MKKLLTFLMILALVSTTLVACGSNETAAPKTDGGDQTKKIDYPTKPINVIVSYAAGGGTDVGARILLPYVEKELGVTMNVINKPGGGGWVGWTELANAKTDGYTIGYINSPNFMTGYLDPKFNRKQNLSSFAPIANHVTDPGAIAIRVDETRFTNIDELIAYAKEHELTATSTGNGSDDHYASLKMNDALGTKFTAVHNQGSADSKAAVLGGHIDVLFANEGELYTSHKNGELKVIATMGKNHSKFMSEVPTLDEAGYKGVYSWSARGIAAPAGTDPAILEILVAAFEKGINNAEQVAKMAEMGLTVDYIAGDEYLKLLQDEEKGVAALKDLMGW